MRLSHELRVGRLRRLPEDHLAFFVLDVVSELDLAGFYAAYRADGRGGSVYVLQDRKRSSDRD
jgi:hypothetical protein